MSAQPIKIPFEIIASIGDAEGSEMAIDQFNKEALESTLEEVTGMTGDEIRKATRSASKLAKSPAKDILMLSGEAVHNVTAFAKNPGNFIFGTVLKKFAKGAGILALALIIQEAVKMIIDALIRPGGVWDRRFRRLIQAEILAFQTREFKHQLRQGFRSVIVTSSPGLRITASGPTGSVAYSRAMVGTQQMEATIPFNLNAPIFNNSEDTKGMRSHNGGLYFGQKRGR